MVQVEHKRRDRPAWTTNHKSELQLWTPRPVIIVCKKAADHNRKRAEKLVTLPVKESQLSQEKLKHSKVTSLLLTFQCSVPEWRRWFLKSSFHAEYRWKYAFQPPEAKAQATKFVHSEKSKQIPNFHINGSYQTFQEFSLKVRGKTKDTTELHNLFLQGIFTT